MKEGKRQARTSELHPQETGTALTRARTGLRLHGEDGDHEMCPEAVEGGALGGSGSSVGSASFPAEPPPPPPGPSNPWLRSRWMLSQVMKSVYHPGYERYGAEWISKVLPKSRPEFLSAVDLHRQWSPGPTGPTQLVALPGISNQSWSQDSRVHPLLGGVGIKEG